MDSMCLQKIAVLILKKTSMIDADLFIIAVVIFAETDGLR